MAGHGGAHQAVRGREDEQPWSLSGIRGAESMSFWDREDVGGGGLVTYLVVTLAKIKALAHVSPQSLALSKSPRRVDSGLKDRMGTLKQGEDKGASYTV